MNWGQWPWSQGTVPRWTGLGELSLLAIGELEDGIVRFELSAGPRTQQELVFAYAVSSAIARGVMTEGDLRGLATHQSGWQDVATRVGVQQVGRQDHGGGAVGPDQHALHLPAGKGGAQHRAVPPGEHQFLDLRHVTTPLAERPKGMSVRHPQR